MAYFSNAASAAVSCFPVDVKLSKFTPPCFAAVMSYLWIVMDPVLLVSITSDDDALTLTIGASIIAADKAATVAFLIIFLILICISFPGNFYPLLFFL